MSCYTVTDVIPLLIPGEKFCPPGKGCGRIGNAPWGGDYRPEAGFCLSRNDTGLVVTMWAFEQAVSAKETETGGAVCRDSCLECFLDPAPSSGRGYLNAEVNPIGTVHLGFGTGRPGRKVFRELPPDLELKVTGLHEGIWAVQYTLPFSLMRELTGAEPEKNMRGNFYHCDETIHPHFLTWAYVTAPQPDFHRPEQFGKIRADLNETED